MRIRNLCEDEDTTYTYDTNCRLSRLLCKTTNGITTKYVYGLGLIGEEVNNTFKTYHFDSRGSTVAITAANGNITDTFAYDTYGKLISRTGTSKVIFGYNGRDGVVTDDNSLIYMRARYYSPEMKRFINADIVAGKLSNAITLNRFAYANGNPVSFVDPFGLSPEDKSGGSSSEQSIYKQIKHDIEQIFKDSLSISQMNKAHLTILDILKKNPNLLSYEFKETFYLINLDDIKLSWETEVNILDGEVKIDFEKLIKHLQSEEWANFVNASGSHEMLESFKKLVRKNTLPRLEIETTIIDESVFIGEYTEVSLSYKMAYNPFLYYVTSTAEYSIKSVDDYGNSISNTIALESKTQFSPPSIDYYVPDINMDMEIWLSVGLAIFIAGVFGLERSQA